MSADRSSAFERSAAERSICAVCAKIVDGYRAPLTLLLDEDGDHVGFAITCDEHAAAADFDATAFANGDLP